MIEYEIKYSGRDLSQIFKKIARDKTIGVNFFETQYFDQGTKLFDKGFSLRARKGNVELKETKGDARIEVRYDAPTIEEGFENLLNELPLYNLPYIRKDTLTHQFSTMTARQAVRHEVPFQNEILQVEACLDATEFYKIDTGTYIQIGEDDELEIEIVSDNGSPEALQHVMSWFHYGFVESENIDKEFYSKPQRARIYDEITLRVS